MKSAFLPISSSDFSRFKLVQVTAEAGDLLAYVAAVGKKGDFAEDPLVTHIELKGLVAEPFRS